VDLYFSEAAQSIEKAENGWLLKTDKRHFSCKMLLGADGANGIAAKQLAGFQMDPKHHCAAVRAYFEGVADLKPERMEIHLLKEGLPGYFWIFPVSENSCNVGFGMLSADVSARKLALRNRMLELIEQHPVLKERFVGAKMEGKVQGFGLPLGSRMPQMAGEAFMLLGDAASLIDPATGEGIGNAMWSGQIAAKWAKMAFQQQRWDSDFLEGYQKEIAAKLGKELRRKHLVQKILGSRPWLIDWAIRRAGGQGWVAWLVKKVF
jgi:flavin-dependent dehydrogenase